jgi:hypothetical protein
LVVTQGVAERLSNRFTTHRLCRARVRGVERPLELFGVSPSTSETNTAAVWDSYSTALSLFEQGQLAEAVRQLGTIDPASLNGAPIRFLADYIQKELGRKRDRRTSDKTGHREKGVISLGIK